MRWIGFASLVVLVLGGCLSPMPKGQEVLIDHRAGSSWSGEGVLLEVSEDRQHCLVALRGDTFRVEQRWVPCRYVHGEGDLDI